MFNLVRLKPRPEPAALAFSSSEPGQSRCWAITNGLAWPGPNRLGLARLMALGWAGHITKCRTEDVHSMDATPPYWRSTAFYTLWIAVSGLSLLLNDNQQSTRPVSAACQFGFQESSFYTWPVLCCNIMGQVCPQYQGNMAKWQWKCKNKKLYIMKSY